MDKKQLKLRNAKLESLTENKVVFIGELKGWIQKLSYTITQDRYYDLLQLDSDTKYNIWLDNHVFRFIPQNN
jgi:uncharacterized FlgJ-related protein